MNSDGIVKVSIISDPSIQFILSVLRVHEPNTEFNSNNCRIVELRHTKSNLMLIDDQLCKPKKIEIWSSGKCKLWFSYPKGKTFSQISFPMEVKILEN